MIIARTEVRAMYRLLAVITDVIIVGVSEMTRSVEAVRANLAFRQADCRDDVFKRAEAERSEAEPAANFFDHALVLGGVGGRIGVEIAVVAAFEVGDNASGDQLKRAF